MLKAETDFFPRLKQGARRRGHAVTCPRCGGAFELLSAPWCGCDRGHPSKICPRCDQCLCRMPDYGQASLWMDPPQALRSAGFERLFVYYL